MGGDWLAGKTGQVAIKYLPQYFYKRDNDEVLIYLFHLLVIFV